MINKDSSENLTGLTEKQNTLSYKIQLLSEQVESVLKTAQVSSDSVAPLKAIAEIEADLISVATTLLVDTSNAELSTVAGRRLITKKVKEGLNDYLIKEGYNPDIHYVYIINYNIV